MSFNCAKYEDEKVRKCVLYIFVSSVYETKITQMCKSVGAPAL